MTIDSKVLLMYFILLPLLLFSVVLIAYVILRKKSATGKSAALQKLARDSSSDGTAKTGDVFYQKVYMKIESIPFLNRYLRKIRRRLELINQDDEYTIRKDSAKITLRCIVVALIASILIAWINKEDTFIMCISLLGVIIVVENFTEQMISKVENKLLEQQLEFFSEVRHAYHGTSMVEEAIYDASLMDEQEIISQANRIYNILTSSDPEIELEKYYDVAPNRFLKIFAGISYLTKEFGDRKVDTVSLYLKNMNNITQELQLEILKRDKLRAVFTSLPIIAVVPILMIHPIKNWGMSSFPSTASFYEGKMGLFMELVIIIVIFLCYSLIVRVKDNVDKQTIYTSNEAWQEKIYRLPFMERIIDGLVPNPDKPAYVKITKLLKDTASTLKLEWFYVTRLLWALALFFVTLLLVSKMHNIAIESVLYSGESATIMGDASEKDKMAAEATSASDRYFITSLLDNDEIINSVRNDSREIAISKIEYQMWILNELPLTDETAGALASKICKNMRTPRSRSLNGRADIQNAILKSGIEMPRDNFVIELSQEIIAVARENGRTSIIDEDVVEAVREIYKVPLTDEQIATNAARIYTKLQDLTSEYFKWTELLIALIVGFVGFQIPRLLLFFQRKMRQMEMDDEVMQFQTIILMLMYIERVSVEYILEWITRFSNIFREPLQRCLNNYESGPFEALEELKDEVTFKPFVRIVESLQSAVENVKITDAFDELETERAFFQERRKESNERLINRKKMIGSVLGFGPMVLLFVGYLIVPLMWTSIVDMGTYLNQMMSML